MKYSELTATQKRRLHYAPICPLCKDVIDESDDIHFTKVRVGRRINYTFFHGHCLTREVRKMATDYSNRKHIVQVSTDGLYDIKETFHGGLTHAKVSGIKPDRVRSSKDTSSLYQYAKEILKGGS